MCGQDALADVIFMYDAAALGARKSRLITSFVHGITRQLQTMPNKLRIGRKTDNCPSKADVDLQATSDRRAFANIDFPGIENMFRNLIRTFPNRLDSKNLAVVFVDESTQSIEMATRVLKGDVNFHVMVVAIGDISLLRVASVLATHPATSQYIVHIPSYMDMKSSDYQFMQKLCFLITNQAMYLRDQRVPSNFKNQ